MRGERERADRDTRRAAIVVGGYNALSLAASLLWLRLHRGDEFLLACAAYAVVSIVHVAGVRAAFVAHRAAYPLEREA